MNERDPVDSAPHPTVDGVKASDVMSEAKQAGSKAASDVSDVAHDASARVSNLVGEVGDQVSSSAEGGKNALAERMDDMAKAVHRSGEQLEGHQDLVAKLVERGADELAGLAATLRSNDLHGLASKLQDLSKRQPALFVGAAMAAGFAAMRFGKVAASGASREDLPHVPESFNGR